MNEQKPSTQNSNSEQLLHAIRLYESNFIRLIRERFGIIVHVHQITELTKTILEACIAFNLEPHAYLKQVQTCPSNSLLLEQLVTGITVGETYFFRDKRQMHLLEHVLLPRIIQSKLEKNDKTLRIWSAACSSGEEIYTILMILFELLPNYKEWRFDLLGTDINKQSLKKAALGHYLQWSMRSIAEPVLARYFTKDKQMYILSPELRNKVKFQYLNMNEDLYPSVINSTQSQDLILCRNLLIYLDKVRIGHVMHKLSLSLVENGVLLLGASDPINTQDTSLVLCDENGIFLKKQTSTFENNQ